MHYFSCTHISPLHGTKVCRHPNIKLTCDCWQLIPKLWTIYCDHSFWHQEFVPVQPQEYKLRWGINVGWSGLSRHQHSNLCCKGMEPIPACTGWDMPYIQTQNLHASVQSTTPQLCAPAGGIPTIYSPPPLWLCKIQHLCNINLSLKQDSKVNRNEWSTVRIHMEPSLLCLLSQK